VESHATIEYLRERITFAIEILKRIREDIRAISQNRTSDTTLVIMGNDENMKRLFEIVQNFSPSMRCLAFYSEIKAKDLEIFYQDLMKPGKKMVLTTTEALFSLRYEKQFDLVLDHFRQPKIQSTESGSINVENVYISKMVANQHLIYGKKVIRYVNESSWNEGKIPDSYPIMIYQLPTYRLVLYSFILRSDLTLLDPAFQDPHAKSEIISAIELCRRWQLITEKTYTKSGEFVYRTPYNLRNSVLLYYWGFREYPLFPCVSIICLIETFDFRFFGSHSTELENFRQHSDVETLSYIWTEMLNDIGGVEGGYHLIREWCEFYGIEHNRMQIVSDKIRLAKTIFPEMTIRPFTWKNAVDRFRELAMQIYQDQIFFPVREGVYRDNSNNEYKLNINSLNALGNENIIVLTISKRQDRLFIDCALNLA
jgi:hypothetical protein